MLAALGRAPMLTMTALNPMESMAFLTPPDLTEWVPDLTARDPAEGVPMLMVLDPTDCMAFLMALDPMESMAFLTTPDPTTGPVEVGRLSVPESQDDLNCPATSSLNHHRHLLPRIPPDRSRHQSPSRVPNRCRRH